MLKNVNIGSYNLEIPIIQGGMGVGVSLSNLAGNVMKHGGMGVISAAHPGYLRKDFREDSVKANSIALQEEIVKAREISGGSGLLGINIMVASKDYAHYVSVALKAKVDAIISGAGLALDLPKLAKGYSTMLSPVVSSGKAIRLIAKVWESRYNFFPDFVIVEGKKAGGHLGFSKEDLELNRTQELEDILVDVQSELEPYRKKSCKSIPVFVAGGIIDGKDIAYYIKRGADGVQMGTRFIATEECDASEEFKNAILESKKDSITLVNSPSGFPGRAIRNAFVNRCEATGNIRVKHCLNCMIPCNPINTPYCISEALIQSVQGNIENGLVFAGEEAYRVTSMLTVKALMEQLVYEANLELEAS